MNVELLLKVKQHILAEPRRLDMGEWLLQGEPGEILCGSTFPECGTIGCISGWAEILSGQGMSGEVVLELTPAQECELFYTTQWTSQAILQRYCLTETGSPEYAQAVADYIDYFIEKYREAP